MNRAGRRGTQMVWVAESLYRGAHFCDEAVTLYTKAAALDARTERCNASVQNLADYCGISKSAAERGLRQLNAVGPAGELPWLDTTRRSHRGGRGRTALRYARLVPLDEAALLVPVAACESLAPRLYRAYLHLRRAFELGIPVTAGELAGELVHHSGAAAGQPLNERTGRRIMAELARAGWITLDHRAGYQGRHLVTVNDTPLRPVPTTPAEPVSADTYDGSGADDHDGSLASKEDKRFSPDVVAMAGGLIRRRRTTGSRAVDNSGHHVPDTFGPGGIAPGADTPPRPTRPPAGYTGPGLQLSRRVTEVLDPVRHLLPGIRTYVLREIAREIGRQLDAGTTPERLRTRLTHRYATTDPVRDPGRWILGAGLPRHGCQLPHCESGQLITPWAPPQPCHVCAQPGAQPPAPPPAVPVPPPAANPPRPATWCACPDCRPPAAPAA